MRTASLLTRFLARSSAAYPRRRAHAAPGLRHRSTTFDRAGAPAIAAGAAAGPHEPGPEPVSESVAWVDGALVPAARARVSAFDHGLLVGDGVFETLGVYHGVPFAWRRHVERLRRSADGLGLPAPDASALRAATDAVLAANGIGDGRLRITVTGGPSPLGSERGDAPPTVIVAAAPARPRPVSEAVVTVPWPRNERGATAGLKTISYAENVRALAFAQQRGASEAVFANTRGELCEATGSNVFLVVDGVVCTPPAASGCLLGVTRALVLELCERHRVPCEERTVPVGALADAGEAFLTSSTREVVPVARVDDRELPAAPGPRTRALADAFSALVAANLDP
jgi:branched-chain amino acid aminotransferase